MSTLGDNGEGIIGQCVFIGGKPHAALETDHSLSMFPQVDVTTCVLPLSEHKRGLRLPPPFSPLSAFQIRTTCPQALRTGQALCGPPWREESASCLDKRRGKLRGSYMKRGKVRGILPFAKPPTPTIPPASFLSKALIFFNYAQETPVTKDTFLVNLQGGVRELWSLPGLFFPLSLSFLTKCVGRRCID